MIALIIAFAVCAAAATNDATCPADDSGFEQGVDFKGSDDLRHDGNATTAAECCAACAAAEAEGCNALSFGPVPHLGCMLKRSDKGREPYPGRLSFVLRKVPTPAPTPPAPAPPPVVEIHMVASNHFDAGCKIHGCQPAATPALQRGWVDPIWRPVGGPNLNHASAPACATTMHGPGQPHAYHVLNRYFSNYFPAAAALGDQARALPGYNPVDDAYQWMTQAWVVDLFLNCNRSNYVADARYGGAALLQCPNASEVAVFKRAVALGDIVWHAAATDQEAGYFPNAGLFEASLQIGARLAAELGVPAPTAVSTRDVPGWTRAALPLLAKHGINGMSFGSGTPPGRPYGVPPLFVWRDEASGAEAVVTSESGYGGTGTLFVLPNGVALAADWSGDNSGPASASGQLAKLRQKYPDALVHCSTFSRFFAEANRPEIKAQLPVVTAEIGDAWIYGVPSDPLKNAQFREIGRARDECVRSGGCDADSAAMRDLDRLLVKLPEHTWGLAQSWFTADYQNYSNADFRRALSSSTATSGPIGDQTDRRGGASKWYADYYTTIQSWYEQRSFITNAIGAVANAEREHGTSSSAATDGGREPSSLGVPAGWAAELKARVAALSDVPAPSTTGFTRVPLSDPSVGTGVLACGAGSELAVALDGSGAIVHLVNNLAGSAQAPAPSWANASRPLGQFLYQTFDASDYATFLGPAPAGFGQHQCVDNGNMGSLCGNFNRPNMTDAGKPNKGEATAALAAVWQRNDTAGCSFVVEALMEPSLHELAGAPSTVYALFQLRAERADSATSAAAALSVEMELRLMNKTATRLPESLMVVFRPAFDYAGSATTSTGHSASDVIDDVPTQHGWGLQMFNESSITLDPTDVAQGGAPHTRCVSAVTRVGPRFSSPAMHGGNGGGSGSSNGTFVLSSLDVPCLSAGEPSPFPTPRDGVPDMRQGVAFNVFNNIWNTNYVLWYPFDVEADKDLKARFSMRFEE